ncbi:hypothetical protein ES705_27804 [subsurface metagenome]
MQVTNYTRYDHRKACTCPWGGAGVLRTNPLKGNRKWKGPDQKESGDHPPPHPPPGWCAGEVHTHKTIAVVLRY